ncbi:MAG: hypothetical protein IPM82_27050 [Saprospiraceae bacterium]|nr:hypothetical protein [Saprospiraceae bacterium]
MKNNQTYRRIAAFLLAALILQVVALKEVHHLLEHHHDAVAHCTDSGSGTHLHGEEYHPEDCFICVFHFAPATLEFHEFSVETPVCKALQSSFFYHKTLTSRVNWHFQLRGPPCLVA